MSELMSIEETVKYVGMSRGALAQLRYMNKGPKYVALTPKTIKYKRSQLDEWIDASERTGTAQAAA